MIPELVPLESIRQTIDFGIITFREDEFAAVLERFAPKWRAVGERRYNIAEIKLTSGKRHYAAIIRTEEQGQAAAQRAASQLITELDPTCLVLVGIAGAKPEHEFSLGDVVLATRLHDFSLWAALPDGKTEVTNLGGPIHSSIQAAAANLPADVGLLGPWNSEEAIGKGRPPVSLDEGNFVGDPEWKKKVREALTTRFGSPQKDRPPLATAVPFSGANVLMKDPALLQSWLEHARDLKAVETELKGVFEAARSVKGDRPVLAIRGISDVVGFKRDPAWTEYACRTAASFAHAFLSADLLNIEPKMNDAAMKRPPFLRQVRVVSCSVEQGAKCEAQGMFRFKLENQNESPVRLKALRFSVERVWDVPYCSTTTLRRLPEPAVPRINIPAEPEGKAELVLSEVVKPASVLELSWNLFSRDAQNQYFDFGVIHAYGLKVFCLRANLETDAGDFELPPLVVHLHGFGRSGVETPLPPQWKYSGAIDGVQEAVTRIENGALADPRLAEDLRRRIRRYGERSSAAAE